jgi:hypothetical protein
MRYLPVHSTHPFVQENVLLQFHQVNNAIQIIEVEDYDRPPFSVYENLEEVFLLYGPPLFQWLLSQFPTRLDARTTAGVSHSTLSRWANAKAGKPFGQRSGKVKVYNSIWMGYPTPFPGMDRICEEVFGPDVSFLGYCIERYGISGCRTILRKKEGFGLEVLRCEHADLLAAAASVGIPQNTVRRWVLEQKYPKQWDGLDRLARKLLGMTWLEAVLYIRPVKSVKRVPAPALRSMLEMGSMRRASG